MFCVEPSEYVPIATNCWADPTAKLATAGVTAMEIKFGAGLDVDGDEQVAMTKVKAVISPVARQ